MKLKRVILKAAACAALALPSLALAVPQIGHEAIEEKIQKMTLEEKIDFIGGYKRFNVRGYEHLGIPELHIADGPVGIRNFGASTAYPASINLAASWDRELAHTTGKAIAMETRAKNVHVLLGPGMNIYRLPITGRNFEYLGEDPYLAAQISKDYIIGMQEQGVMANAKHYVANNQEFDRNHTSSDMDERTLHEIYLPAFKTSVEEANVASVMTGYNPINGIQASQHDHLNNKILKGDWGFEGFVVSDWVSTYDGLACAKGGLDLEMPSGAMMNRETLIPAIKNGELEESVIDDKIRRLLRTYDRFGLFKNPDISKGFELDKDFVRQAAIDAARGGMVLVKNEKDALPLERKKIKKIAVIGPNATPAVTGGGGSSFTRPLHPKSFLEAVKEVAGDDIEVVYEQGIFKGTPFPKNMWDDFPFYVYKDGKKVQGAHAEFYNGLELKGDVIAKKFYDRVKLEDDDLWSDKNVPKTNFSVRFTTYYTAPESGYYSIGGRGDDGYRILMNDVEVVELWRHQGPTSGKHDLFLNAGEEHKIVLEFYQAGGGALIYLGMVKADLDVPPDQYTGKAVAVAKDADVVLLSVGFNPKTEGESYDRTFEMPYKQSEFIKEIAKANDNVAVVLNSGGNVEMESWINDVNALLLAWYPGQEGNLAAAEILFGDTNPSGKLPASFEKDIKENPTYDHYFDHDKDKRVFYGEGIFMGYRYWDQAKNKPRYPFGYGLSYTDFKYSKLKADKKSYKIGDTVKVSVKVKNTGDRDGAEVVQVYVKDKKSSLPRPEKELKGFDKVHLKAGETKTVDFELNRDAFAFYNPKTKAWEVEPGKFEILVGSSSADIRKKVKIKMK